MEPEFATNTDVTQLTITVMACPECGAPAAEEWRTTMSSTDGPMEHVKIRCLDRHWFLLPASYVKTVCEQIPPA